MNLQDENKEGKGLEIEFDRDVVEGVYTNVSIVNHSAYEFILDFARLIPNIGKARLKSRVVMNPVEAKRLLAVLTRQIQSYEAQYGLINDIAAQREDKTIKINLKNSGLA